MADFIKGLYEVTITLKPHLYELSILGQLAVVKKHLPNVFKDLKYSAVAELTKDLNVHVHSMVEINTRMERDQMIFRYKQYSKIFGKWTHDVVRHKEEYMEYMKKDIGVMYRAYDIDSILNDDLDFLYEYSIRCPPIGDD